MKTYAETISFISLQAKDTWQSWTSSSKKLSVFNSLRKIPNPIVEKLLKTTIRNNYTKHSDAILSSIRRLSVIVLLSEESKPHFWIFHIVNILYISKIYLLTICILWFWRCSTTNGICLCANIADVLGKLELIISILFNKNRIQKSKNICNFPMS